MFKLNVFLIYFGALSFVLYTIEGKPPRCRLKKEQDLEGLWCTFIPFTWAYIYNQVENKCKLVDGCDPLGYEFTKDDCEEQCTESRYTRNVKWACSKKPGSRNCADSPTKVFYYKGECLEFNSACGGTYFHGSGGMSDCAKRCQYNHRKSPDNQHYYDSNHVYPQDHYKVWKPKLI